jgi:hypothetical protein
MAAKEAEIRDGQTDLVNSGKVAPMITTLPKYF